jgi:hypothetical protein
MNDTLTDAEIVQIAEAASVDSPIGPLTPRHENIERIIGAALRLGILQRAEQPEDAPLEITEQLTKFGPGWRKVMAYYCDILDCIRETVGPGHTITDGCPPGDPWHMVPRSVIDEMRNMFRAVVKHDLKQAQSRITADAFDAMLKIVKSRCHTGPETEGCALCINALNDMLIAGGITVG